MMDLERELRVVPNFPKDGVDFLDFSPLLENHESFQKVVESLREKVQHLSFSKIVGIESRGFILGAALAQAMGKGFVMVRKKGKLPGPTVSATYDLEYGTDTVEMLPQSIEDGEAVILLDDVLATGGTAKAASELIEQVGGEIQSCLFLVELGFLNGRSKIKHQCDAVILRQ